MEEKGPDPINKYAELRCKSNFSFLEGASHPEELIRTAKNLNLSALAITDRNGFYGVVRAHTAAKKVDLPLIIGSEVTLPETTLVLIATSRRGYGHLSQLISIGRQRCEKGKAEIEIDDLLSHNKDLIALAPFPYRSHLLKQLKEIFASNLYIAIHRTLEASDKKRTERSLKLSRRFEIPVVATNDVYYHESSRQPLQDVLTAIRHRTSVDKTGYLLFPNRERRLKSPSEMARLFRDFPQALQHTLEIAEQCHFSLDELRYIYPDEFLPPGKTTDEHLADLVWRGAKQIYTPGIPEKVRRQLEHELRLIGQLKFADYFLTIHDIVTFARKENILCQGRGSAANSVVCYVLGVTAIDPVRMNLLFERFISAERGEPPDIDVDFEHERREEVIQYIYKRYGRHRAGMVSEVIRYKRRSAVKEVTKALGPHHSQRERLIEEIQRFPRHLSVHVGGFVLTRDPLIESVPIENARMKDRTIIQWNKDDLDAVGMLKLDILGLGMLTCIRKCFASINRGLTLSNIPAEDPKVYDMICKADTVGVFQIESRAQMGMLPRLKPRTFHDLVVEVAIVRPGPIQGGMVHPYLRRRRGEEPVHYPHPALKPILEKTYGIPLFQEQVMKIAVAVADFTPGEADELRRAMGVWRTHMSLDMTDLAKKLIQRMHKNGISPKDAEVIFRQIQSFGEFGFPESHSASFALLVYASAYLKCYYPAEFTCALINSQPMGFYANHTLLDDAARHACEILPVDVRHSLWDCTLETGAIRLGFRLIRGLGSKNGKTIERERKISAFSSPEDFSARCGLTRLQLFYLAAANAFSSFRIDRREALWRLECASRDSDDLTAGRPLPEEKVQFASLQKGEEVATDYRTVGYSTVSHPATLFRHKMNRYGAIFAKNMTSQPPGSRIRAGGMVIVRQSPPTARGMVFVTLEDETGFINVAITPKEYERMKKNINRASFLLVEGVLQRDGLAHSILASQAWPMGGFPLNSRPQQ